MWDQQPLDNRKYFANSVCIMRSILILSCSDWLSIVHHFTGAPIFSRTMLNVRLFAKTWMHFGPESANQKFWVEMGNYRISGIKIRIIISLFYPKISKHFLKPMSDILIYLPRWGFSLVALTGCGVVFSVRNVCGWYIHGVIVSWYSRAGHSEANWSIVRVYSLPADPLPDDCCPVLDVMLYPLIFRIWLPGRHWKIIRKCIKH